ncbi:MAG: class I SAM-dependent methyltransferase [Candidatus Limnocylindrales bacterium]|jgi:ubiquinone/menaquinone biosynthesis C-methylase UbiE
MHMLDRRRAVVVSVVVSAAGVVAVAAARRSASVRERVLGRPEPSGRLLADAGAYDLWSRLFFGPIFRRIAADVASVAPPRSEVLEVGCGPGHLAIRMARDHGLRVTASDLDSAMVVRAQANIERVFGADDLGRPGCTEADVAALPFPSESFDVVVSTFSMHHWADASAGLAEIHRVLRPGGRALVWDFSRLARRLEGRTSDPAVAVAASPFRTTTMQAWQWPGTLRVCERVELRRAGTTAPGTSA